MSHSLAQVHLHVVFSTKDRVPFLSDPDFRARVHRYLAGACRNLDCPALIVGGTSDHVHLLCRMGKNIGLANLIRELKIQSSKWIKAESPDPMQAKFGWQKGYGIFCVESSHLAALIEYIETQEQHHRSVSFQEEYQRILKKNGIEVDEHHLWD